ncbi:MAG: hydrogenase maturation nickel metallochaperone HypA [Cellulosilyticaceae bacterium]
MHEYPITCEILRLAEAHSMAVQSKKVIEIGLVVGDDSGFIGDSIQMYFEVLARGTVCEQAKIHITHIRPKMRCMQCEQLFERKWLSFNCPACGSMGSPTEIGKEFYLEYIKVEE